MTRPKPDSFTALLHELTVERFYTTDRDRPQLHAGLDTPEAFNLRRQILNEAMAETQELAPVVPIRRERAA
jgi:hypothetical protein